MKSPHRHGATLVLRRAFASVPQEGSPSQKSCSLKRGSICPMPWRGLGRLKSSLIAAARRPPGPAGVKVVGPVERQVLDARLHALGTLRTLLTLGAQSYSNVTPDAMTSGILPLNVRRIRDHNEEAATPGDGGSALSPDAAVGEGSPWLRRCTGRLSRSDRPGVSPKDCCSVGCFGPPRRDFQDSAAPSSWVRGCGSGPNCSVSSSIVMTPSL
jgi:hypothetical protein